MERKERIKAMGFNPDTVWYHGTNADFDTFHVPDEPKNGHTYGAGVYFTKNPDIAHTYTDSRVDGSKIIPVHLKLKKELKKPLTYSQIHSMISDAPNVDDSLNNFGEVRPHTRHKVLHDAVSSYHGWDNPSQQLNAIHNDFYHGKDAQHFLDNVMKHTKADHHYFKLDNDERGGVVVYHPSQIRSIHAKYVKKNAKSGNILESFKDHLVDVYLGD